MSNDFKPLQGMSDISGLEIQKMAKNRRACSKNIWHFWVF